MTTTSPQLGFGCVRLTYHLTYRKALENLATAYDAGITHFDVARLYGFGTAEKILGQFIKDKRDKVTVTSKFGIFPGNQLMGNLYVQNFARHTFRILKKLPIKQQAQQAANEVVLQHRNFSVGDAEKSLHTSLQALRTDHIDYYLLHEPCIADTQSAALQQFLQQQQRKGCIGAYGIGSFTGAIVNNIRLLPAGYTVLQTDHSFPFLSPIPVDVSCQKQLFFFSPFRYYSRCKELLEQNKLLAQQVSQLIDADAQQHLLNLFLMHPFYYPVASTTLFTSSHNQHIKDTVERWRTIQEGTKLSPTTYEAVCQLFKAALQPTADKEAHA